MPREGGRGLVHDDDSGTVGDRLGNLHGLYLGNREVSHQAPGIDIQIQILKELLGPLSHGLVIHKVQLSDLFEGARPSQTFSITDRSGMGCNS